MNNREVLKIHIANLTKRYTLTVEHVFRCTLFFKSKLFFLTLLGVIFFTPAHSEKWIEIAEGTGSGDTYLWPYFYTASRFVDTDSINKKDNLVVYRELINARKAISKNVLSLIVLKKSSCDGKEVLWQKFSIYKSAMGQGTPIMKLNPNEMQELKIGDAGFMSDAFVCKYSN
tara:strand:+ start:40 stop:555 length:516 start_codon:yes stop_codon:yes gene_type:complete